MDFSLASITIQQIIVFLRVVEYGGFAKASHYLNMTQSAVSKSIAKLEKDLGIVLFQRTTREIRLTDAGKVLYEEWKEQIGALHNSYIKAAAIQSGNDRILHIGILNTARPELYFWQIQEQFTAIHPEIQIELDTAYMTDLEQDLCKGKYDLIMIPDFERYSITDMGLCWKWAACNHAYVIMSIHHPLAKKGSLKTTDILYEKFSSLEQADSQNYQKDLTERFERYHVKPSFASLYKNAYEIRLLFRKHEETILMADEFFDYPADPYITKIPVEDQMNGIICAWNPNNVKPQVQAFLDALRPVQKRSK